MRTLIVVFIAAALMVVYNAAYIVDETEQVVITQFGRVVGEPVTTPGLNFKLPFLQQAIVFPKNLLTWDGDPGQVPTKDKTYIWVDMFARWKIVDAVKQDHDHQHQYDLFAFSHACHRSRTRRCTPFGACRPTVAPSEAGAAPAGAVRRS